MTKISIWAGEGCLSSNVNMLFDALAVAELWHRADDNTKEPLFEIEVLTSDGKPVTGYGGLIVHPHRSIMDVERTDFLMLATIMPNVAPMPPGLSVLKAWIEALRKNNTPVSTICTGAFLLAEMGFLSGKTATTNWHYARLFRRNYPDVNLKPKLMMAEDGGFITTGATTAGYNLVLHIIRTFCSEKLASLCSKIFLVDPGRDSQTPYTISTPLKGHGDQQILKAQMIIEQEYPSLKSIDSIAKTVGISHRHFSRRFRQATGELPVKYLQRTRIDAAKELLETTLKTTDEITWDVGYQDVSSFCRLFRKATELSPKAYRDKFFCGVQPGL